MHVDNYNYINLKSDRIFDDLNKFTKVSETLLRLSKLDLALGFGKPRRKATLDSLQLIWVSSQQKLNDSVRAAQENALAGLSCHPNPVRDLYSHQITAVDTNQAMQKALVKFQKDTTSVLLPPLKKAGVGEKGPTLLVNFQRIDPVTGQIRRYAFVIKWSEQFELSCNRVYEAFLMALASTIATPIASGLDLNTKVFETSQGTSQGMTAEDSVRLYSIILEITKLSLPAAAPKTSHIMISKRIEGENLFDFAKTKYPLMNVEQKTIFFHRLGQLAMLDMVIGTLDRLVRVMAIKESDPYSLNDAEANLGNVMVVWSDGSKEMPRLYAIDNEVEADLVFSDAHREKYNAFLKTLFSGPNWVEGVSVNMVKSIKSALLAGADNGRDNVQKTKAELKTFSDDVASLAPKAFRDGLQEMAFVLQRQLIGGLEGIQTLFLKTYLNSKAPQLLQAVSERLELFKSVRSANG